MKSNKKVTDSESTKFDAQLDHASITSNANLQLLTQGFFHLEYVKFTYFVNLNSALEQVNYLMNGF